MQAISSKFSSLLFPKAAAWLLYAAIILLCVLSLWHLPFTENGAFSWDTEQLLHILGVSLWQAFCSASLSLILGVFIARAFYYLEFKGKSLLLSLIAFAWVLPSFVIIFAVIGMWGNVGWLAQFTQWLGFKWDFQLYGLQGILIAHLLFNIPFVVKQSLQALNMVPSHQQKLAAQLQLTGWQLFRVVELPKLRLVLPYCFSLIMILCFTSFPIVLMLGGGPKYSTLEVAIYQAVTFEFNFAKVVPLAILQCVIGLFFVWLNSVLLRKTPQARAVQTLAIWKPVPNILQKIVLASGVFLAVFGILLPLLYIVINGLSVPDLWQKLQNPKLWNATGYSLAIGFIAACLTVAISFILSLELRQLLFGKKMLPYSLLSSVMIFPVVFPTVIIAVGLFLFFLGEQLTTWQLLWIVAVGNALSALPYIHNRIFTPLWELLNSYDKLARSLGLTKLQRWKVVEAKLMIKPLLTAWAMVMSISVGSFAVIAFFGNQDFTSLPHLLYQQLGSYRTQDAAVTALVLLLFSFVFFLLIEWAERKRD